jgi:hypothetical protein
MKPAVLFSCLALLCGRPGPASAAAELRAGVARVDITDYAAGPVNDPAYVKALVLRSDAATAVLVTVDAVAIGEIGYLPNSYLGSVRARLRDELGLAPSSLLVNASHCHAVVRKDADLLTVQAVKEAWQRLTPVHAGAGRGREDRIMENRRMRLRDGRQADVRRAYALPRDEDVVSVGPVDPEIGLLRLDRPDGTPLAVVYNFAAHPIQGVPGGGSTADYPGFASRAIEENLPGAMAFFVQGCAGDINPAKYKDASQPQDAEPLGNLLGLSVLRAVRTIRSRPAAPLAVVLETLVLPRAADYARRIAALREEQQRLVDSLTGTSLNFEAFLTLYLQHRLNPDSPAYYRYRYLHEQAQDREHLRRLDSENRAEIERYLRNIEAMEQLTRLRVNLALLEKHRARTESERDRPLEAEVAGLRVGDFRLVTFPGELAVEIGLRLKQRAPGPFSFVAGYTNGYLYYTPTAEQRNNTGYAQEDCDTLVAPEWQELFEERALGVLRKLD